MAITESQKSSLTKSLKKLRSSLGSLKGADKKRFESSSTSDKLSRALGGASTSLRKQQQQEQQSIAMGTQELNQTPTEVITVPKLSEIPNYQSTLDANNMALGLTPTETTTPGTTNTTAELLAAAGVDMIPKKESLADDYMRAQRDLGKDEFQRQVNDYSAQINAITAKATADQLRVTGQGRGIPEAIIGGQQAQIAKEAAIQALPIQAQLAAAQGNLKMAQDNLNTWYNIRVQDVENDYQYKTKLFDAIQGQISKEDERRYNEKRANIEFDRDKEMLAIKNEYDVQQINLRAKDEKTSGKRELISAGFTDQEIQQIDLDVNQYGLEAVLNSLGTIEEKRAVQDAYGQPTEYIDKKFFEGYYSDADLVSFAEQEGYYDNRGWRRKKIGDVDSYLDALMLRVEELRRSGMTDDEIIASFNS